MPDLREEISELKSVFVNRALANLQNGIDAEEQTCPVCGREADRPILELIQERIGQYEASRQNLAADYSLLHPSLSAPEIEERLVGMGNLKASDLEILSYCIGQGDKSACEKVNQQKRQYTENQRTIERISNENEMFFNNLKMREKELRDLFTSRFGAGSVLLDDKEKQLVIALPRNIETYSTGETNLMTALVKINEFLASDKEVLAFDDPLSSLDRANQYFIMFELIRIGQQDQKKDKKENVPEKYATIFTHNMDCISIAESQFRSCFSYCCMERIGDNILFNPIPSNFFAVVKKACRNSRIFHQGANPGSLCAESILLYCKQVCATAPTNSGEDSELDEEAAARSRTS